MMSIAWLTCFIISSLCWNAGISKSSHCCVSETLKCAKSVLPFSNEDHFAKSPEDLDEICRSQVKFYNCVRSVLNRCGIIASDNLLLPFELEQTWKVVNEICTNRSEWRTRYLNAVKCMNRQDIKLCQTDDYICKDNEEIKALAKYCWLRKKKLCAAAIFQERCGDDAKFVYKDLTHKIFNDYDYSDEACSEDASVYHCKGRQAEENIGDDQSNVADTNSDSHCSEKSSLRETEVTSSHRDATESLIMTELNEKPADSHINLLHILVESAIRVLLNKSGKSPATNEQTGKMSKTVPCGDDKSKMKLDHDASSNYCYNVNRNTAEECDTSSTFEDDAGVYILDDGSYVEAETVVSPVAETETIVYSTSDNYKDKNSHADDILILPQEEVNALLYDKEMDQIIAFIYGEESSNEDQTESSVISNRKSFVSESSDENLNTIAKRNKLRNLKDVSIEENAFRIKLSDKEDTFNSSRETYCTEKTTSPTDSSCVKSIEDSTEAAVEIKQDVHYDSHMTSQNLNAHVQNHVTDVFLNENAVKQNVDNVEKYPEFIADSEPLSASDSKISDLESEEWLRMTDELVKYMESTFKGKDLDKELEENLPNQHATLFEVKHELQSNADVGEVTPALGNLGDDESDYLVMNTEEESEVSERNDELDEQVVNAADIEKLLTEQNRDEMKFADSIFEGRFERRNTKAEVIQKILEYFGEDKNGTSIQEVLKKLRTSDLLEDVDLATTYLWHAIHKMHDQVIPSLSNDKLKLERYQLNFEGAIADALCKRKEVISDVSAKPSSSSQSGSEEIEISADQKTVLNCIIQDFTKLDKDN